MQQQPSKRKMLWIFGIIFAVMILLGNSVLVALVTYSIVHEQSSAKTGTLRDGNLKLSGEETDVANVVAKVSPTVVSIITAQGSYTGVKQAAGTGVIISSDGYVLTNKHVINGAHSVRIVTSDGDKYDKVSVVGSDPLNDIAFLKIRGAKDLPAAELGNSSTVKVGQKVITIGNSLGQYKNTVTGGIISGKGRPVVASSNNTTESLTDLLQTDAPINQGNSGGPLINLAGQVIGINTAIVQDAQSVGFSIPINATKGLVKSILEGKGVQKSYIGVRYISITPEVRAEYGLSVKSGAYIGGRSEDELIAAGSPAAEAGLRKGDIITKINDKKVGEDGGFSTIISEYAPGETVRLTVLRGDSEMQTDVTLGAYKL